MDTAWRPLNLEEALYLRASRATTVLAGGTDLLVRHRRWSGLPPTLPAPALMVGHLPELKEITIHDSILRIGACCTLAEILDHDAIPRHIKLPLATMASPSIRNIATLGGNIANASPAGDSLPMLYALDATLTLQSVDRTEDVGIADFITGPGATVLRSNQIITRITIPLADYSHIFFEKVAARRSNAISKLSLYAVARRNDLSLEEIRIAFGSVAATIVRSREAETLLTSLPLDSISGHMEQLKIYYGTRISPIDDQRSTRTYRHKVAFSLLERYLTKLARRS